MASEVNLKQGVALLICRRTCEESRVEFGPAKRSKPDKEDEQKIEGA